MDGPFVPIDDVAKHFSVSVSTIRTWVRQGHIPKDTYIKVGNTYRFSLPDVCAALAGEPRSKAEQATAEVEPSLEETTSTLFNIDDLDVEASNPDRDL